MITCFEDEEPDFPKYSDPGWIVVDVNIDVDTGKIIELEVLDYDNESSVYWMIEGGVIKYVIERDWLDELTTSGVYRFNGITGQYFRGDWGFIDDDEEWGYETVIKLTEEEADAYRSQES